MKKKDNEMDNKKFKVQVLDCQNKINKAREELKKVVVGQDRVVTALIKAIICKGHILLEGVPGIAKTLIIKSFAEISAAAFSRIQFTPDLLPTDIIGITVYNESEGGGFSTIKGPIFGNFILGDEINRSPAKVQSALLEAMQEKQVTIGTNTFALPDPFFVLATQNPIESMGTYPLPAAQLDRFLFKVKVDYPNMEQEKDILEKNITIKDFKEFNLTAVLKKSDLLEFQNVVHNIYLDDRIKHYIVKLVDATRNPEKYNIKLGRYIDYGGSPRASIAIYIASKAEALLNGKIFVIPEYVKKVTHDVLRHRILVNYEGQSENISPEQIIDEILAKVPMP